MVNLARSGLIVLLAIVLCLSLCSVAQSIESNKRALSVLNKAKSYLYGENVSIEDAILWFDEVAKYYPQTKEGAEASANKIAACGALAQSFLQSRARALQITNRTSDEDRKIRIYEGAAWDYADALWEEYESFVARYSGYASEMNSPQFALGGTEADGFVLYFNRVFGLVPSNGKLSMSSLHFTVGNLFFYLGDYEKAKHSFDKVLTTREENSSLLKGLAGARLAELNDMKPSTGRSLLQSLQWALGFSQWFANDYGRSAPELQKIREITSVAAQIEPIVDFVAITLDPDIEIDVGRAAALRMEQRYSVYESTDISTIGLKIAGASDKPDMPYTFRVIRTDQPNAFAFPGGMIYVTEGLLNEVINSGQDADDRLACVIGHEVTHVVKRDGFHNLQRRVGFALFKELAFRAKNESGDKKQRSIELLADYLMETVFLGYGRKAEFEADCKGVEYAHKAGYKPEAMISVLAALGKHENPEILPWLRTHPPANDRIRVVRERISLLR